MESSLPATHRSPVLAWLPIAFYTIAISVAELLLVVHDVQVGVILHGALLLILVLHYSLQPINANRPLLVFSLLPLLRIISLMIPDSGIKEIYWVALIGTPLLVSIGMVAWVLGFTIRGMRLGLHSWLLQVGIAGVGIVLSFVARAVLEPQFTVETSGMHMFAIYAAILLIFSSLMEELLFRGLLQSVLEETFGSFSLVLTNVFFVVMYLSTKSVSYLIFVGAVGLFFSWCVRKTNSIWGVTLAHAFISINLILIK